MSVVRLNAAVRQGESLARAIARLEPAHRDLVARIVAGLAPPDLAPPPDPEPDPEPPEPTKVVDKGRPLG